MSTRSIAASRIDPETGLKYYRLFNPIDDTWGAWKAWEVAIRHSPIITTSAAKFRLENWDQELVIDPVVEFWKQTADYRAGRSLQTRKW